MSIVLRAINDNGVKYDLDLFQNENLRLDISAIESGEIGDVFGVSSQQFALPSTMVNDEYFGNLYDLGASPAIAFTKTAPCQVLYNGAEVFTGKLYLDNIVTDHQGDTIYNIHVVNEVVDFKFQIQDLTLSDLNWSEYDHTLTIGNITSSWEDNLFSGDIKYPLVNYGYNANDVNSTSIEAGGNVGQFDNSQTPLRDIDFRPAVKAKAVIDKIFDSIDYEYSSSFFDSDYFNSLYILATEAEGGNQFASPTTSSLLARVGSTQNLSANTQAVVNFATEQYDNGNNWATNTYTAPQDGQYTFYAQFQFGSFIGLRPSYENLILEWYDSTGAVVLASTQITLTNTQSPMVYIGPTTLSLSAGDTIQLRAVVSTPAGAATTYPIVTGKIEVDGIPTLTGGDVDLSYIWGEDTPVRDLLDGLIQKFNLVFEPISTKRNTLVVEPFNEWADNGQVVDWSNKVDYNQKWEIRHPLQDQPKDVTFTDIEDSDALNAYHLNRTGNIYGSYYYKSDSDLAIGEKTIGAFFSPTPMKGIDGAPTMIVPQLGQREEGRLVPYKFNPRLLYDVGMVSGSNALRGYNQSTSTGDPGKYWILDDTGTPVKKEEYPLFHHLALDVDNRGSLEDATNATRDLHFGNTINPGHWSYHQRQYNAYTKQSAFYQYWAFYINELYDIDSRKVTLNIKLDPSEIQDIRLNDKIFIDGHYYRIDKITGANLLKEDSIQVTLLKTLPRKLYYPRRRIYDDTNVPIDVTFDDASFSLSGQGGSYNDFNTGAVVTGSVAEEAASRDGFSSYDGGDEIVWKTNTPNNFTLTSANNFGNNDVRFSANKVSVTGENNVIREQVKQVNVLGESNDVSEYSQYSSVSGQQNTIGSRTENIMVKGFNHQIGDDVSFANIIGGTNAIIDGGTPGTGSFNAIINTDEGNIRGGQYNTLLGGFGGRIESSSFSTMIGENHYISSSIDTTLITNASQGTTRYFTNMTESVIVQVSKDMDGADYPAEKLYVGDTYFTEEIAEDFFRYTGSIPTTLDLNSDVYSGIYSFFLNPNGTGQLTIDLPPCTNTTDLGYRRKLKFTTQNRAGATYQFTTQAGESFYVTGDPTTYDFNFDGAVITFQAIEVGGNGAWVVEDETRGSKENEGAYGSFYDTTSQAIVTSGSAQQVTINSTFASKFTSLSGSGAIEMDYKGAYSFTYTTKVQNADNVIHYADFWIKYNGTDYPNSSVRAAIPARKNASEFTIQPVTIQLLDVAVNDGDYIELYWRGDSTLLSLEYETFGGSIPAAPSVRATIHEV